MTKLYLIFIIFMFFVSNLFAGPLTVSTNNPRYFTDSTGRAVYLSGFQFWDSLAFTGGLAADGITWAQYLSAVSSYNVNAVRIWVPGWNELSKYAYLGETFRASKAIYARNGGINALDGKPKFDLTTFDQSFFDDLRSKAIDAGNRGIYAIMMLFEGHACRYSDYPWNWDGHFFNSSNNVQSANGVNGTSVHTLTTTAIVNYQKAYLDKIIATLDDLNNVIYEIINEAQPGTDNSNWQEEMITYIKANQAKTHPILRSTQWDRDAPTLDNTTLLFSSGAEAIAPGIGTGNTYGSVPPVAAGTRVVILDSDHVAPATYAERPDWMWKLFTRGYNLMMYMELPDLTSAAAPYPLYRSTASWILTLANRINLHKMIPSATISSTTFALYNAGDEYLVYQPSSGNFTVNLTAGNLFYEWFRPSTGLVTSSGSMTATAGDNTFTPAYYPAVLWLKKPPKTFQ